MHDSSVPAVVYRGVPWAVERFGHHPLRVPGVVIEAFLKLVGVAKCRFCTFYHPASVVGFPSSTGFFEH